MTIPAPEQERSIDRLEDEVARLRAALEFYADPFENSEYRCVQGHDKCGEMYSGPDCPYCERDPIPAFYNELEFGRRAFEALTYQQEPAE